MEFRSVSPYDGITKGQYQGLTPSETDQRIQKTHSAYMSWSEKSIHFRASCMRQAAKELRSNLKGYSESITTEMGKVIRESEAEIEKCVKVCDYYADNATTFLADELLTVQEGTAWLRYQPLGVILAIMPWNFPFWQVFRFAAPALMAGNACLLKHASNVPRCALDIEDVFRRAGFPESVFTTLLIGSTDVESVIAHEHVVAVTLTGSEAAGSSVASIAGRNIKKTVLELGGSDPFIVLADADIPKAAAVAVRARMLNCGQSCIAAKRFIIEKGAVEEFTSLFITELGKLKYGDPKDRDSDYGTLARQDIADEVFQQVKKSIDLGADVLYGKLPDKITSASFPPMVLTGLKAGMPAHDEEVFGPVACFYYADNLDEIISITNNSRYGLGSSVWSQNREKSMMLAQALQCGAVYINQMMFSDPAVPFGGVKKSGYGRELSAVGIREFTNQKTVWAK